MKVKGLDKTLSMLRGITDSSKMLELADNLQYEDAPESIKAQVKKHVGSANPKVVKTHFKVDDKIEKVREKDDRGDVLKPKESKILAKIKSKAMEKSGDTPKVIEKKSTFVKEPGMPPFFEEKQRMTKKPEPKELDFIKNYKSPASGEAKEDDLIFDAIGLIGGGLGTIGKGLMGSVGKGMLSKLKDKLGLEAAEGVGRMGASLAEKKGIRSEAIERALANTKSAYGRSAGKKDSAGVKSARERLIELGKVKEKVEK